MAERLTFKVAACVEDTFQILSTLRQCAEDYKLIILSTSNQHYICACFEKVFFYGNIVSLINTIYFTQYIVDARPIQTQDLQEYLLTHLKTKESPSLQDIDQSSVHAVTSTHSGVG